MSEHVEKTIADLQSHIASLEEEANDAKKTVNSLCKRLNRSALYADTEATSSSGVVLHLQGDEYHNRPQATVVREVLESRKASGAGPATVDELYETMVKGGYEFTGKNEDIKKRGLTISLAKNTAFYKLPNGKVGIREWYGVKDKGNGNANGKEDRNEEEEVTAPGFDAAANENDAEQEVAESPGKPR